MPRPLPNEKQLYEQIKKENITVSSDIWGLLYNYVGDNVTAISLLCQYYLDNNESIPVEEAKRIITHTRHIKDIVNKATLVSKENFPFPEFSDDIPLHSVIREMVTHYIGNDVYVINLIVGNSIDPMDPKPLVLDDIENILVRTRSIKNFMDKLREATSYSEIPREKKTLREIVSELSREEIFLRFRKLLAQEFKIEDEKKISFQSRFYEDLSLDSVDTIRVVMLLEECFGVEIPDSDAEGVLTVGQAVDYISKRLKERF